MPSLVLSAKDGSGNDLTAVSVTMDGQPLTDKLTGVSMTVDPGPHAFTFEYGGTRVQAQVLVNEGRRDEPVAVVLGKSGQTSDTNASAAPQTTAVISSSYEPPTDPGAPSRSRSGVIASGVVTGVFAVGTIVTSILYSSKLHAYNAANDQLAADRSDLHSQTKTLGVANLALLGGTLIAAGVTVYLWTRASSKEAPRSASLELRGMTMPGLAGFSVEGRL